MRVTMRTFQLAVRGLPDLRNAPQTMDFTMRGQTFTADVTPDPDGGSCATVRGRGDGFTEADTLPELRKGHAEVVELMVFGAGRPNGPGARFHVGTLRCENEIPLIPKTPAGPWLTCGRGRRPRRPASGAGRPTVRPGARGRVGARDARPYHDIRPRQESRTECDPRIAR